MVSLLRRRLLPLSALIPLAFVIGSDAVAPALPCCPPTTAPAVEPLEMVYVFSPTCLKCAEASKLVDAAASRYAGRVQVQRLNIQGADALEQVMALEERHKVKAAPPPRIFVGSSCLTGLDEISQRLDATITRELGPPATSQPEAGPTTQSDSGMSPLPPVASQPSDQPPASQPDSKTTAVPPN